MGHSGIWRPHPSDNNAFSARGSAGGKASEQHREVILPTCLSLTESVATVAYNLAGHERLNVWLSHVASAETLDKTTVENYLRSIIIEGFLL